MHASSGFRGSKRGRATGCRPASCSSSRRNVVSRRAARSLASAARVFQLSRSRYGRNAESRSAAVIWVNPHRGKAGYEPLQAGVLAALPFCDAFVSGHSLAALEWVVAAVRED